MKLTFKEFNGHKVNTIYLSFIVGNLSGDQ